MKVEIVALGHDFLRVLIIIIAVSILIENIPCIHKYGVKNVRYQLDNLIRKK